MQVNARPPSRARRRSVRDRPELGQFPKYRCVGAIRLPDWTGGIAPQVHRARFLKAAIEATAVKLLEYVATFDCVEIETEHRRPTIQEIELPVVYCVADLHRTLLHSFNIPSEKYDLRTDIGQT